MRLRQSILGRRTLSSRKHPAPTFEHHELKAGGWYVVATWYNGRTQHVGGFATEAEAIDWIKNESAEWTRKHSGRG